MCVCVCVCVCVRERERERERERFLFTGNYGCVCVRGGGVTIKEGGSCLLGIMLLFLCVCFILFF